MKGKFFLIILICLGLIGCATMSLSKIASANRENLSNLLVGMTKEEVLKIMGVKTEKAGFWDWYTKIKNPYKSEILRGKDKTLEAVYYFTSIEENRLAGERPVITDNKITPLIFDNGVLIGWGWDVLYSNVEKYGLD